MNKHLNLIAAAALSIGGLTFVGCDDGVDTDATVETPRTTTTTDDDTTVRDNLNRAGEKVEGGLEKTGDAVERGVEKTGDAMKEAGRDIRDGADRAEDRLDKATTPTTRPADQTATPPGDNGI
jgi:predicted phage gp36 major capsid-like protein